MRNYASPVFQHRHYALIAQALADHSGAVSRDLLDQFAALFARDNPKFKPERFYAAARGVPSNGKDKR